MLMRILKIGILILVAIAALIYTLGGGFGDRTIQGNLATKSIQFAHRGLINDTAENSLIGFELARKSNYVAFETDVSATLDKQLVLFHDKNGKRLLGIDKPIDELTYSKLQQYDILYKDKPTQKVPLLSTALSHFEKSDSVYWYLDIKTPSKWMADSLVSIIKRESDVNQAIIASSNILFLSYLKWKEPEIQTVLEGYNAGKEWTHYAIPRNWKPDYYASFLNKIDDAHIRFLINNNLLHRKIVYGVTQENLDRAKSHGITKMVIDAKLDIPKIIYCD